MKFQGIYRAFMVPVHHTGMKSPFHRRTGAGSPIRLSLLTGLLIAACAPALAPAQVNAPEITPSPLFSKALPDLGDETDLSIATERRLGDSIVRSLYRDPDYLDDPVLTDYVQSSRPGHGDAGHYPVGKAWGQEWEFCQSLISYCFTRTFSALVRRMLLL